jgi:threonine/homoserine/homoserine lactone efflux protein
MRAYVIILLSRYAKPFQGTGAKNSFRRKMMTGELFLPFVLAATLILIVPGPTILLVISQAVSHGRRSVVPLVVGVFLGDLTAITFSLLGLGVLMSTSAFLFSIFKWIGAIYLIYLGVKRWQSSAEAGSSKHYAGHVSPLSLLRRAYIVTALNPKSITFFVAFLPQFVDPLKPAFSQLTLLGGTFLVLAAINATVYAIFAGRLSDQMRNEKTRKLFNLGGGSALIGAGIFTVCTKR